MIDIADVGTAFLARHARDELFVLVDYLVAVWLRGRCRATTFGALVLLSPMNAILYAANVETDVKNSAGHDGIWCGGGANTFVDQE